MARGRQGMGVRAVLGVGLALVMAPAAQAATFPVDTTADSANATGCTTGPTCSLREAIAAANAAAGADLVVVPAGTYRLTLDTAPNDEVDITTDMTIRGAGARSTIVSGEGLHRVFNIQGEPTVRIENLTVTGGITALTDMGNSPGDGGGILSDGDLTLSGVAVKGNTAQIGGGGVSTESEAEGGVEDFAELTLVGTTVSGNRVQGGAGEGEGGGILVFGNLTATNSTITGNAVTNPGAAQGGAIVSVAGTTGFGEDEETIAGVTILRNVSIAGNSLQTTAPAAGLGGGFSGDNLGVDPFSSELRATNTIIAGNTVNGTVQDCALTNTTTTVNNLSSDATCGFAGAGNRPGTSPRLGTLRNNGGPTDTLLPAASSPAVNGAAAAGCPPADQRGVVRPQGSGCDIGAVELAPPLAITGSAEGVSRSAATVTGIARNPAVSAGTAYFDFGTSTAYGRRLPAQAVAAGAFDASESAAVSGLRAGTLYHYRLVVVNSDGVSVGPDSTFRTDAARARGRRPGVRVGGVRRTGCVRRAFRVTIRARAASGTRIRRVRVRLDGRLIKTSRRGRFSVRVDATDLRSGRHTLGIRATDRRGRSRVVRRSFRRCAAAVPIRVPNFTG